MAWQPASHDEHLMPTHTHSVLLKQSADMGAAACTDCLHSFRDLLVTGLWGMCTTETLDTGMALRQ
jgi:hypothetical protein